SGKRPPLTRVALDSGFSSSSDFSRCFRQRFGASPRAMDLDGWRKAHRADLEAAATRWNGGLHPQRAPAAPKPDRFKVKIRSLPERTVAYIRVSNPYKGDAVVRAIHRLVAWADARGLADGQWLGYQWENPELVDLDACRYYAALVADGFAPGGEIGRY